MAARIARTQLFFQGMFTLRNTPHSLIADYNLRGIGEALSRDSRGSPSHLELEKETILIWENTGHKRQTETGEIFMWKACFLYNDVLFIH